MLYSLAAFWNSFLRGLIEHLFIYLIYLSVTDVV